ncbi:suppressor of tub2 mutation [Coemansia sp. RSA 2320]|nr:suppressor of tub2 mutation [Coemansia sp. RSA 2320]
MVSEFLQTASVFAGRETEDNWVQRERAINLYRGMVWGNAAIEHTEDLVGCLKEGMLDVFKVVNSLRTSLSAIAMCLCEDVAMRLGPHAGSLFDTIVDVLVRQCTQTKKLSAQRAAKSLEVVFHYFPLRPKAVDSLRARMADKSAILRQAVVATCTGILRSHGYYMAAVDRRFADVLVSISEVVNVGVTDAQPSVREAARELYWALYSVSAPQATKLLPMFPDSTRAAIVRDKPLYARGSAAGGQPFSVTGMEDDEHIEAIDSRCGGASDNDEVGTAPLSQFISENSTPLRLNRLRAPIQARMPLGLIDFSQMEVDEPLVVTSMPSRRILPPSEHTVGPTTAPAASGEEQSDSQATAVVAAAASISTASSSSSRLLEPTQTCSDAGYDSYHPSSAAAKSSAFDLTSAPTPGRSFTPTPGHILTPDRTPLMSPSPRNEPMQPGSINAAPVPGFPSNQFATPRTQTARYWHGPVEMFMPVSAPQLLAVESPMLAEARQRSAKIEGYLQRLEANSNVDEALFRSLARFAKDESSSVWINEANGSGGGGYLDRILHTCLSWLQAPAESRDTVFAKDRCFDVLRVLIHRKSQHFSLDISRRLLLEVLRNKFFDSTILSTSAEDVFYDMATHLDPDLCFELAEDFFKRASLPLEQSLAAPRSGYASCLESQISTPPDMDPMRVFAMDNALAGMFEFVVEVVKRLPSPDSITPRELEQFMPYSVACFIHPRSQVRKAALMPMVAVHEKLGLLDTELEELLLQTGPEQLAASPNPLARYVGMLHRPELRRLVWSYYLSKRDA